LYDSPSNAKELKDIGKCLKYVEHEHLVFYQGILNQNVNLDASV
jgi:hypothetical protein